MTRLQEVKSSTKHPLRQASLLFLIKDHQVLLALKKRGWGVGKWSGVGGKPEERENIEQTAIREAQEEIGVTPKNIKQVATINFYFEKSPPGKDWNQQVVVYFSYEWEGEPEETEEMAPKWFDQDKLPFEAMWDDDPLWLPRALKGEIIIADSLYDENQRMVDFVISK